MLRLWRLIWASLLGVYLALLPGLALADECGARTQGDAARIGSKLVEDPITTISHPRKTVVDVVESDPDVDCDTPGRVGALGKPAVAGAVGAIIATGVALGGPWRKRPGEPKGGPRTCDDVNGEYSRARAWHARAERERDALSKRLERARRIHMANQVKLMGRSAIEIGQVAGGGLEGIRAAGTRIRPGLGGANEQARQALGGPFGARSPAEGPEDAIRGEVGSAEGAEATAQRQIGAAEARAGMLAEPARQIRARIAQIEQLLGEVGEAQSALNHLLAEEAALNQWFIDNTTDWYARHPTAFSARHWGRDLMETPDTVRLDGAPLDRAWIEQSVASGKFTPAEGAAKLAEINSRLKGAAERMARFHEEALKSGWTPELEQYLAARDPQKFTRLQQIHRDLTEGKVRLEVAEDLAPPELINERTHLRTQLSATLDQEAQGSIPQSALSGPDARRRGTGAARVLSNSRKPPWGGPQWETPEAVKITSEGLGGTLADLFSPLTWLWRKLFVGEQQSPEDIGRILRQGMDSINRLEGEIDARHRQMDAARQAMQALAGDLDVCRRWTKSGLARPVKATVDDLRRALDERKQ